MRRAALWSGTILSLPFAAALVGFFSSPAGDQADLRWLVPGFWLWVVLFGVFPVGWVRSKIALARGAAGQP